MKHTETINSRAWAREARRHCRIRRLGGAYKYRGSPFIQAWVQTIPNFGWIRARPCYKHCGVEGEPGAYVRRIELTGGWIIEVQPSDPHYLGPISGRRTKRFRVPGPVDLDKLARYMGTAEAYVRKTRILIAARERLYELIEAREVPATIIEQANRLGLPIAYTDMTEEHCLRWAEIAKGWPLKEQSNA